MNNWIEKSQMFDYQWWLGETIRAITQFWEYQMQKSRAHEKLTKLAFLKKRAWFNGTVRMENPSLLFAYFGTGESLGNRERSNSMEKIVQNLAKRFSKN